MVNKLIDGFLEDKKNRILYATYLNNPSDFNKQKIEDAFKVHAMKIRFLSYFSKVIFFEAQRFDKKIRAAHLLPLLETDEDENTSNSIHLIYTENKEDKKDELVDYFEDERLYDIISNLSEDNRKILYWLYVSELNEAQVAKKLGVTKQVVNKRKNNLLKRIRKFNFY